MGVGIAPYPGRVELPSFVRAASCPTVYSINYCLSFVFVGAVGSSSPCSQTQKTFYFVSSISTAVREKETILPPLRSSSTYLSSAILLVREWLSEPF